MLPVPAPATALLLTASPIYARGPAVELTTPTGAALAATLATHFGALPPMSITAIGYGAGDRDFPDQANVLRVLVGERTAAAEALAVSVIEANIDDSSPQVLGYAMERLLEAGALDVSLPPLQMKKNRPGTLLRVIAKPEDQERLAAVIFAETSTLGPAHLSRRAPRGGAPHRRSRDPARQGSHEGFRPRRCRAGVRGLPRAAPRKPDVALKQIIAAAQRRLSESQEMKYYLTTPIYYVNAAPHIGHAYTTIAADTIKRLKRMQGYDVVLTTGTDEHGQKIERAAAAAGKTPQEFTDIISAEFRTQWEILGLEHRPLPAHHRPEASRSQVQDLFQRCLENGYIYKGSYTGQYCVFDELYVNDAKPGDPCPECGRPTETVTEENYFFKLSAFQRQAAGSLREAARFHPARNAPQ